MDYLKLITEGESSEDAAPLEPGNIDLAKRPVVKNRDGSVSTVKSASFNIDGAEVLLPTIADDGTELDERGALDLYRRTGKHLGKFKTPAEATAYAEQLHQDQEKRYAPKPPSQDYLNLLQQAPQMRAPDAGDRYEFSDQDRRFAAPADDPQHYAGLTTQAAASLPTDLKARAEYFARQRFPKMDPKKAAAEFYGVSGGRLYYINPEDNKPYFEEPGAGAAIGARGLRAMPAGIASSAGPLLPQLGAGAGAMVGTGGASVPGAAAGAAAGDVVRQALAAAVTGEDKSLGNRALQTGFEAALGAGGQFAGNQVVRQLGRGAARDLARLGDPREAAMVAHLQQASQDVGVPLTPAEITNLKSLRGQQRMVGESDLSGDELERFMRNRNENQVPDAVNRFLGTISPQDSVEAGGRQLQQGADAAIARRVDSRRAATRRPYAAADADELPEDLVRQVIDDAGAQGSILDTGNTRQVMDRVQRLLQREVVEQGEDGAEVRRLVPRTNVRELHAAKEEIDAMLDARPGEAETAPATKRARRALRDINDRLTDIMERESPNYELAQRQFQGMSGPVTELTEGPVAAARDMAGDRPGAARILFDAGKIGPEGITSARRAYAEAGRLDDWNAGARAWLQEQWTAAAREFKSGNPAPGASFRARVFGDQNLRENMRAALAPEQYAYALRLMDVLEATGRAVPRNSDTAYKTAAMEDAKREAGGMTAAAIRAVNPTQWPAQLGRWYQDLQYGNHMEQLARAITAPDAMQNLRALRQVPPTTAAAARLVTRQLFMKGGEAGRSEIDRPEDYRPGSRAAGGR